ncbi:hypothetical protein C900_03718 [Fulvivirga imtechensis AK7]|uniref:Uncharacterized protein n=1 Tax=Fulvivirga imtechensis AK7 TaxID=1237149 RepID=L8JSJ4_9BACT|nr:hypothetical protein C900_03718 [Fulvivirga imtechensis AK7]
MYFFQFQGQTLLQEILFVKNNKMSIVCQYSDEELTDQ